jgi:O-antigen/teichoic acid export membrane protein
MIVRAIGTVGVLIADFGLVGMAAVHVSTAALNLLIYSVAARKLYEHITVDWRIPLSRNYKSLLSFAAPSFAIFVLSVLSFHTDNIVIGAILPIEFITFYAIAANLWKQANGLTEAVSHLMTPRISALASRGSTQVPEEIVRVNRLATLFIAPVAITFFFRGETFIGLWMGPEYADLSGQVLAALAIVLWQGATRSVVINSLTGLAEQKRLIPGLVVEALANIILSILLIGPFGLFGVALGTLIPNTINTLGVMPWIMQRAAGVSMVSLYVRSLMLPTVTCLPFALAIMMIENEWQTDNLPLFFLQILIILPLVPILAWFTCLSSDERDSISRMVSWKASERASG